MQLIKNEIVNIQLTDLGSFGEGVGKTDGFTVFVPGGLPGELVEAKVTVSKKNYAVAQLMQVLKQSPYRVSPPCTVYKDCGGCQLQHLSYQAQLEIKKKKVIDALERIGHVQNPPVKQTLGALDPWHYRNKMLFAVDNEGEKAAIGCYARASHNVVDAPPCLIQQVENNVIMQVVRDWMRDYKVPAYDEHTAQGLIRNVLGRVAPNTGQVMAGIVTVNKPVAFLPKLVQRLKEKLPNLTSIVQLTREGEGNIVLGGRQQILWGNSRITGEINDLLFNISAKSFFQVNSEQVRVLYGKALQLANLQNEETVIEAYCGTGTISMIFAQKAKKVYGLELLKDAVSDAKENAALNNCANIEFIQGDVVLTLPQLLKAGVKPDTVVVDPPRAGLAAQVTKAIIEARPKKIVYISCNPASLARDIALMSSNYNLKEAWPVDMFPMTAHVESVCLLTRNEK